jgi:hypothetical protein
MFVICSVCLRQNLSLYNNSQFKVLSTSSFKSISDEISQLKKKVEAYESDLHAAKAAGDKEDIGRKENLLISEKNLLLERLIAKDSDFEEGTRERAPFLNFVEMLIKYIYISM